MTPEKAIWIVADAKFFSTFFPLPASDSKRVKLITDRPYIFIGILRSVSQRHSIERKRTWRQQAVLCGVDKLWTVLRIELDNRKKYGKSVWGLCRY